MWAVILDTFCTLDFAQESNVTSPPTVFALGNSGVHVCFSDSSNEVANVETSVDKHFSVFTTLYILNVNPNDGHVGFGGDFNNSWF